MLLDATSYNRWVCPKIEFTINWLRSSTSHTTNLTKDMGSVSTCHRNYIYSGMRLQSHLLQKMYFLYYLAKKCLAGPKTDIFWCEHWLCHEQSTVDITPMKHASLTYVRMILLTNSLQEKKNFPQKLETLPTSNDQKIGEMDNNSLF